MASREDKQLSRQEQRVITKLREAKQRGQPALVTVYLSGKVWQIWDGQPGGTVKEVKDIDN